LMINFNFYKRRSFGIDLGNNNTLVSDQDRILLSQPSYIAFHAGNHAVKAVGDEAYKMFEKTPQDLKSVKPLKGGVIADFDSAREMIHQMLQKVFNGTSLAGYDNVISGVPYATTDVERRALRAVLDQFSARHTYLLYEPLAAALGMGLDIREPNGKMIVDIGGGITEMVVISLSGIAAVQSIKMGGDTFDVEIQDHFRRTYNMAIGLKTAEAIKIAVGAVRNDIPEVPEPFVVRGKNTVEGIPAVRTIGHEEVALILNRSIKTLEDGIIQTIETCPPELAADIYENGIFMTGGGALLRGIRERVEAKIRIPVHIDYHALTSVNMGISRALRDTKKYRSVLN